MEGGEGHVDVVEGVEVGEFEEGGGFGVEVGGFEFAADLVQIFGDEGGLGGAGEVEADAFDQVVESALEEGVHQGRTAAAAGHRLRRSELGFDWTGAAGGDGFVRPVTEWRFTIPMVKLL